MPLTYCQGCIHFRPDPINPEAGMRQCAKDNGYWHPMAMHLCRDREERNV